MNQRFFECFECCVSDVKSIYLESDDYIREERLLLHRNDCLAASCSKVGWVGSVRVAVYAVFPAQHNRQKRLEI